MKTLMHKSSCVGCSWPVAAIPKPTTLTAIAYAVADLFGHSRANQVDDAGMQFHAGRLW